MPGGPLGVLALGWCRKHLHNSSRKVGVEVAGGTPRGVVGVTAPRPVGVVVRGRPRVAVVGVRGRPRVAVGVRVSPLGEAGWGLGQGAVGWG